MPSQQAPVRCQHQRHCQKQCTKNHCECPVWRLPCSHWQVKQEQWDCRHCPKEGQPGVCRAQPSPWPRPERGGPKDSVHAKSTRSKQGPGANSREVISNHMWLFISQSALYKVFYMCPLHRKYIYPRQMGNKVCSVS